MSACITVDNTPTDPPATATATATATPSGATPPTAPPTDPPPSATPMQTATAVPAGPPFPAQTPGVVVYDLAGIFSPETEATATATVQDIAGRLGARMVIYTQFNLYADEASTRQDAIALSDQWDLGDDALVIFWNTNRTECIPDRIGNGQVQLYAATEFRIRISDQERQRIFDEAMLPLLRQCDEDGALLSALESIDAAAQPQPSGSVASDACTDPAHSLSGFTWSGRFEWHFNADSVPARYDANEVLGIVRQSIQNITAVNNDCGLADNILLVATYRGVTTEAPCSGFAENNVVGFGKIPPPHTSDALAETCHYGTSEHHPWAHIIISSGVDWALSLDTCEGGEEMLEATLTHEVGHIFGLGHVGELRHGDLTMSTRSNGPCNNEEATLGLGDVLGLEELYGSR